MAKRTYIAVLEPAEQGGYGVSFPDLPGCVTFGDDLTEAMANAHEALSLHLDGMVEDGETLPAARDLRDLAVASELPGTQFVYASISVDDPEGAERVNVYISKGLLAQIERFGQRTGIDNRSTFFRLAARQYLSRNDPMQLGTRLADDEVKAFVAATGAGGSARSVRRRITQIVEPK